MTDVDGKNMRAQKQQLAPVLRRVVELELPQQPPRLGRRQRRVPRLGCVLLVRAQRDERINA
jgi:hypothetical protein